MADLNFGDIIQQADIELAKTQVDFKLLEEGEYPGEVTGATVEKHSVEGYPIINLEFTLENKRKQWLNLRFSENENSRLYAIRALKTLGVDVADVVGTAIDPEKVLLGKKAMLAVKIRKADDYVSKDRNEVKWINSIPGVDNTVKIDAVAATPIEGASAPAATPPANPFD
jgi:hypothetical protein